MYLGASLHLETSPGSLHRTPKGGAGAKDLGKPTGDLALWEKPF